MVFEYFSYGVAVAVAALLCRGLRAAVLQRENASMRAYVLRGSFRSRLFACLCVQAFSIFYAGVHAKVSPYYLFPLARMANPILTSPVLNPCKLVHGDRYCAVVQPVNAHGLEGPRLVTSGVKVRLINRSRPSDGMNCFV